MRHVPQYRWVVGVVAAVLVTTLSACSSDARVTSPAKVAAAAAEVPPTRSLVSYGGQFLASCPLSHERNDDPIMHRGHPGMSHAHEFFGNTSTDATSTYASMIDQPTTCSDMGDRSGYWVPALYLDGKPVKPRRIDAYYRVAAGVDPGAVKPFPKGLEVLAGNQHATHEAPLTVAAWACGGSPEIASAPPKNCTTDRPVQLRLTFPSCWDGEHTASADHTSHMAYPSPRTGCDRAHPVALAQLTVTVHYAWAGPYAHGNLASGSFVTTHGDFFAAWQPKRIADQVSGCLARSVTCGLVGGTFHTGRGAGDVNSYNRRPGGDDEGGWAYPSGQE